MKAIGNDSTDIEGGIRAQQQPNELGAANRYLSLFVVSSQPPKACPISRHYNIVQVQPV